MALLKKSRSLSSKKPGGRLDTRTVAKFFGCIVARKTSLWQKHERRRIIREVHGKMTLENDEATSRISCAVPRALAGYSLA